MSLSDPPVWPASGFRCAAAPARRDGSPIRLRSTKTRMAKWARGLVLLIGLLTPDRAHAQEPADGTNQVAAQELAAQGFEAYKAGRYHTALQFYDQALEAHPAAALYFNVA